MRLKRAILFLSLGLLVFTCGLCSYVIFTNSYSLYREQWIELFVTVSLFSLPMLVASYLKDMCAWRPVMKFVILLSLMGMVATIFETFFPMGRWHHGYWHGYDGGIRLVAPSIQRLSLIWSVALPALAVISMPKLSVWAKIPHALAYISIALIGVIMSVWAIGSVFDLYGFYDHDFFDYTLMIAVLIAASSVMCMAIICKLNGQNQVGKMMTTLLDVQIICPRSRLQQMIKAGKSCCLGCNLRFDFKIEEPRCPRCDYLINGLSKPACPECGHTLVTKEHLAGRAKSPV